MTSPYTFTLSSSTPVQPAFPGYLALALTEDTELQWPWVDQNTETAIPFWLDVTPTGAFSITLPDARAASTGQAVIIFNLGASTISILGNAGGAVTTIVSGAAKYLLITDNSTVDGSWRVITFGAGTSQADASALAGYGLQASGATLQTNDLTNSLVGDYEIGVIDRAQAFVVTAATGAGTLSFDPAATLGNGFWIAFSNLGTGAWTLDPHAGEEIDNVTTLTINPGESCFIICNGTGFTTFGRGRSVSFTSTSLSKDVAGSSNVTLSGTEAANTQIKFIGILTGNIDVIFPAVVGEWYINNATTGSFTLTAKTSGGSGVSCPQSQQIVIKSDGTDMISAFTQIPSGALSMADGSVTAPGLAFANELSTGFSRPAAGQMSVSVLAAEVFRYTASLIQAFLAFTVKLTDNSASIGPIFTLWRSSTSPAASDLIGTVNFDGMDSAGVQTTYAAARATIADPTNTSEDGVLDFYTINAGSLAKRVSVAQGLIIGTTASDIGAGGISAEAERLLSTDAGASAGPTITLQRDSASPAANDLIGLVSFTGEDSGGTETIYGQVAAGIISPTDTAEDGKVVLRTMDAGTLRDTLTISGHGTLGVTADLAMTDSGPNAGPVLNISRISATPAAADVLGFIGFKGTNDAATQATYASISALASGVASGQEIGGLIFTTHTFASGNVDQVLIRSGVALGTAAGGDKGAGTINATGYYLNGSALTSTVIQTVNTQTGAVATGTTVIPFDDTKPQNTEGDQYMSLAITPTSATSKLEIQVVCNVSSSANSVTKTVALFQDSTADALAAVTEFEIQNSQLACISFTHTMTAGTTSATTFKVRAGASSANTMTFNGSGGARIFGGVMASSITITEYT